MLGEYRLWQPVRKSLNHLADACMANLTVALLSLAGAGVLRPLEVRHVLVRHPLGPAFHGERLHGGFLRDAQCLKLTDSEWGFCFDPYIKTRLERNLMGRYTIYNSLTRTHLAVMCFVFRALN